MRTPEEKKASQRIATKKYRLNHIAEVKAKEKEKYYNRTEEQKAKKRQQRKNHYWRHREEILAKLKNKKPSERRKTYRTNYKQKHRNEINKKFREETKICRMIVIDHYSNGTNSCVKCGFGDERALTIDHINGGGQEHKKSLKGTSLCRWLVRNRLPEGYQVLCMNCQRIKVHENKELPYTYIKRKRRSSNDLENHACRSENNNQANNGGVYRI